MTTTPLHSHNVKEEQRLTRSTKKTASQWSLMWYLFRSLASSIDVDGSPNSSPMSKATLALFSFRATRRSMTSLRTSRTKLLPGCRSKSHVQHRCYKFNSSFCANGSTFMTIKRLWPHRVWIRCVARLEMYEHARVPSSRFEPDHCAMPLEPTRFARSECKNKTRAFVILACWRCWGSNWMD